MQLIGIAGPKRSGKGTVAEVVSAIYNDGTANVKAVGFADKVKIAGMKALGFDRPDDELIALADDFKIDAKLAVQYRELGATTPSAHDLTGREYFQWIGTEVGRELFGETFWIDQVLPDPEWFGAINPHPVTGQGGLRWQRKADEALENQYPGVDVLCITDIRFQNEALRVLALGGQVWEVVGRAEYSGEHVSETPLPRAVISQHIDNSGDLMDLEIAVETALNLIPFN